VAKPRFLVDEWLVLGLNWSSGELERLKSYREQIDVASHLLRSIDGKICPFLLLSFVMFSSSIYLSSSSSRLHHLFIFLQMDHSYNAFAATDSESPTVITVSTRKYHGKRSNVWDEFDEVFEIKNGKRVCVQATCKHCGEVYSGFSTGGTRHLIRYIRRH
jgi:hypothetical protein